MGAPAGELSCDVSDRAPPPGMRVLVSESTVPLPTGIELVLVLTPWREVADLLLAAGQDLADEGRSISFVRGHHPGAYARLTAATAEAVSSIILLTSSYLPSDTIQ